MHTHAHTDAHTHTHTHARTHTHTHTHTHTDTRTHTLMPPLAMPVSLCGVCCSHCAPEDGEWQAVLQSVLGQEEAVLEAANKEGYVQHCLTACALTSHTIPNYIHTYVCS